MAIVYVHKKKIDGEPFYVGIGKQNKRAFDVYHRSKFWKLITSKYEYVVEILHENISWQEACKIEKELISLYGRRDLKTGILVNQTIGGDGNKEYSVKKEVKDKLKKLNSGLGNPFYGKKHSKETIEKLKISHIGKPSPRKDMISITDGQVYKFVKKQYVEKYLLLGWIVKGKSNSKIKGIPSKGRKAVIHSDTQLYFDSQHLAACYFGISDRMANYWIKIGKLKRTTKK